jgi:mannitol-specific phosphotransferase system IIBC component
MTSPIHKIVVACDAGMGSSVMLAAQLRRDLRTHDITVEHCPIDAIPADVDVVVCHAGLAQRARAGASRAAVVPIRMFLGDPAIAGLISAIKTGGPLPGRV